jgi:hypothetical protein
MKAVNTLQRFSKGEAESKLGQRVRAAVDLTDIPKGAAGRVMEMDEIEPNGFDLIIEWDLRMNGKIQHDWFAKEEYERSIAEA